MKKKLLTLIRRMAGVDSIMSSILPPLDAGFATTKGLLERQLFLTGQIACGQVRQLDRLTTLADAEFRVTSQWGEDGIIEWLCHMLPGIPHSFVEFGVEHYQEANTRFLLQNRNWRGLIIDGDST